VILKRLGIKGKGINMILIIFFACIQWCNRDLRCKKLQLTDLLVSPVHHLMKVPLVIKDIEIKTDDPEEKLVLSKIWEVKESSLSKKLSKSLAFHSYIRCQLLILRCDLRSPGL